MTYWELEPELWETLPDDSYDGARHMEHRGRVERIRRLYNLESSRNDSAS